MYLTVDECYKKQPTEVYKIFQDVENYFDLGVTAQQLFNVMLYEKKSRLINYIFDDIVTEADFAYIRNYVNYFCEMYKYKFDGLIKSTNLQYNPIENYNRTETTSNTRTPDLTTTAKTIADNQDTNTRTPNLTNSNTKIATNSENATHTPDLVNTSSSTDNTKNAVTTFDSTDFSDTEKSENESGQTVHTNGNEVTEKTDSINEHTTNTFTGNEKIILQKGIDETITTKENGIDTTNINSNINGNIGVTTSQQMIEQERKIVDFSVVYEFINDISNYILLKTY